MSNSEEVVRAEACVPPSELTQESIRLTISGATPFTELRVLDAQFEPIPLPANTGSVTLDVSPGLYEVAFRNQDEWQSQHVIAAPGSGDVHVEQPSDAWGPRSAGEAAYGACISEVRAIEDGATLVFSLIGAEDLPGAQENATGGAAGGGLKVSLIRWDGGVEGLDLAADCPRTWRFAVPPGHWRLRVNEAHPRNPFELPVTIVPGYVAQVQVPVREAGDGPCVDLDRLRFRLLRADAEPAVPADLIGFEEAALGALSSGRSLFGPDLEQLIDALADDKALNPMLGVYAAYLCDRSSDDHARFRQRLLERLAELTGGPEVAHPDVAVLRLGYLVRSGQSIEGEPPVRFPPMLAVGWRLLLEAARMHPGLIPSGSVCERVAGHLWSSSLWTAWSAMRLEDWRTAAPGTLEAADPEISASPEDLAASQHQVTALLRHVEIREWFRSASGNSLPADQYFMGEVEEGIVSAAEAAVASALYPIAESEERQSLFSKLAEARVNPPEATTNDVGAMAEQLGLPTTTVERALNSLADKLNKTASSFNITSDSERS